MNKQLEREQMFLEMLYEKNEVIKQLNAQINELKKKLEENNTKEKE